MIFRPDLRARFVLRVSDDGDEVNQVRLAEPSSPNDWRSVVSISWLENAGGEG